MSVFGRSKPKLLDIDWRLTGWTIITDVTLDVMLTIHEVLYFLGVTWPLV